MRILCNVSAAPLVNTKWWNEHVEYSKIRRQGIDIVCASFNHPKPKANVIILTGLSESFLKYSEIIEFIYEQGFNVFTYDHQSQGLSGRCKLAIVNFLWLSLKNHCLFRVIRVPIDLDKFFR